jgi:primase-polymerase (primpol)-like protein
MHKEGTAYVLIWEEDSLPDFIDPKEVEIIKVGALEVNAINPTQEWITLFVSGGRKDKISKGDIAGLFFKQGKLEKGQLGNIELKDDCAFVAVTGSEAERVVELLDNARVKKRKVRVRVLEE